MSGRNFILLLVLFVAIGTVVATTEIVLQDGRVIAGIEVWRDGDNYVVELENGQAIVLPAALVDTVRLLDDPEPEPEPEPEERGPDPITGLTRAKPQDLGAPIPAGPSGLVAGGSRQLAGEPVQAPSTREQRGTLGEPAEFQKSIIDPSWQPSTDWNMDPNTQNNFAPSTWAEDIVDHSWEPESAWDADKDVLEDSRSTFSKSIVDNSWTPTDGFAK